MTSPGLKHLLLISLAALLLAAQAADAAQYKCLDGKMFYTASKCNGHGGVIATYAVCGDGVIDTGEQCDEGANNSDIEPDGCRTQSCRRAWCGDSVVDSGEQCDRDYLQNAICSDFKRGGEHYWGGDLSCKDSCRYDFSACHYCGDGRTQSAHEQCDDGNTLDDDGCNNNCTACVSLNPNNQNTNIEITGDTQICTKNYDADDYGDLGVIIIKAPNVVVDCDFARLTGTGDGIGIYIKRSDHVTVKNCILDNYEFGIYAEDSNNIRVLGMGNKMYNTSDQLVLDNSTALPAPPPTAEMFNSGIHPNAQSLMGQKLQTRRVPSRVGDSLKMKAKAGALIPQAGSTPAARRVAQTPVTAVPQRVVRPHPERVAPKKVPAITFPASGQRFTAPASFTARARFDRKQRVVFLLKTARGKKMIQRSSHGHFSQIKAGSYCVSARYVGKSASSRCVAFTVSERKTPVRQTRPLLQRP